LSWRPLFWRRLSTRPVFAGPELTHVATESSPAALLTLLRHALIDTCQVSEAPSKRFHAWDSSRASTAITVSGHAGRKDRAKRNEKIKPSGTKGLRQRKHINLVPSFRSRADCLQGLRHRSSVCRMGRLQVLPSMTSLQAPLGAHTPHQHLRTSAAKHLFPLSG